MVVSSVVWGFILRLEVLFLWLFRYGSVGMDGFVYLILILEILGVWVRSHIERGEWGRFGF